MSIHTELQRCWDFLGKMVSKVDVIEGKVSEYERPRMPVGRETPYFIQQTIPFAPFEFQPKELSTILDAERTTKVVRLTANVTFQRTATDARRSMRPSPYGYVRDWSENLNAQDVDLFDFEWSFALGSTDRRYTNGRGIPRWNSRHSLGSPESHRQLLISEKFPLILAPTEMFTFYVKPLLYNMDPQRNYTGNERFFVTVTATCYRVFGVEVDDG